MLTRRRSHHYTWIRVSASGMRRRARGLETKGATESAGGVALEIPGVPADRFSFADALEQVGVPATELSPEDELVDLLLNAAEIEHGLMLQYLYATYSLQEVSIAGVLRMIAIEEMGHFITVQNVLAACGAPPYLGHGDWSEPSLFRPFPFRLEPASIESIAKYTIAEMPDRENVPADIQPDLADLVAAADESAQSPVEPHRVGLLYAKIYWLLRQDDHPLPDESQEPWPGFPVAEMAADPKLAGRHVRDGFVIDARKINAQPEHWASHFDSVIVAPIADRQTALAAIASVSAQGEGFDLDTEGPQGHFQRFTNAWRLAKAAHPLALKAAIDPWYSNDGMPATAGDEITSVVGRLFAQLGDGLYELVLLCTAANLLLPPDVTPSVRNKAARACLFTMRDCLGPVGRALSTIPLTDANDTDVVCGMPFMTLPLEIEGTLQAVVERALAVIATLQSIVTEINDAEASPTLKAEAQGIGNTLDDDIKPRLASLPV